MKSKRDHFRSQNRTVAIRREVWSQRSCQILPRPFVDHWKCYWFSQNFLFDQQKRKYLRWFRLFFYKHKSYFKSLEKHGKNTHLCTLDVERNNVKVQEILVSFPNEKRMNGKQNNFLSILSLSPEKPQLIYDIHDL